MSTTPSRCRQRASTPGGAPSPGPSALRTRSTWTRPATPTAQGNTRTRARPQADCSGSRTTPSEYAHKDPDLRNTHRTQGLDSALVCGPVLRNSLPCVRHQRTRTPKKDGAKERTHQPTANPNQQTGQPPEEGMVNRMEPRPHHLGSRARTAWEVAPTLPGARARTPSQEPPGPLKRLRAVPPATPRSGRTSGAWRRTGPGRPRWTGAPNPPTRGRTTRRRRAPGRTAPPGRGRAAPAGTLPGR